jgi:hypothetical protein
MDIWTNDPRAPLKQTYAYTPGERVMSHWHTNTWMDFQVSAADARPHRIALYFADWQPLGPPAAFPSKRAIRITATDTATAAVVARNAMSDYTGGVYLVYTYTGSVTFRIENLSNPLHPGAPDADASLTAVFWGGM